MLRSCGGGVRIPFLTLLRRRSNALKPREAERLYAHIRAQFDADEARHLSHDGKAA
jgi:hypothetical protein